MLVALMLVMVMMEAATKDSMVMKQCEGIIFGGSFDFPC